jgi:hypothetical protein
VAKHTEIAVVETAPLAEQDELAALLQEYGGTGTDTIGQQDIVRPRLVMLQPTSPLASEEGYRGGYLINSISQESFGPSAPFYILHYYPTRTHWMDPEPGGPVDCVSQDMVMGSVKDEAHAGGHCDRCPFNKWTTDAKTGKQKPPDCTEFKNLIVVPAADPTSVPLLYSAKRSGLKAMMELLSNIKYQKGPIFGRQYIFSTEKKTNDQGTFFVPKFAAGDPVSDVATLKGLINLNKQMKLAQDRIVQSNDDTVEGGAGDDGEGAAF